MLSLPVRLVWNVLLVAVCLLEWLVLWPTVLLRARQRRFVTLELSGGFRLSPRRGLASLARRDRSYEAIDRVLTEVERDPNAEGIVLRIVAPTLSLPDASLLRQRLMALRAAGKRVVCVVDSAGLKVLLVASAADTFMMAPAGRLFLPGLAFELTFLGELLEQVGLRAQFIHIGRYKTAGHLFTRRSPTEAQRDNTRLLLDDLGATLADRLRRDAVDWPGDDGPWTLGPTLNVSQARRLGLVDHQAFSDQVPVRLRAERDSEGLDPYGTFGDEDIAKAHTERLEKLPKVVLQKAERHARRRPRPLRLVKLWGGRPAVVVVEMSGMILPDEAGGGPLSGRPHISPSPVRRLLRTLRESRSVKAVVLAIDSRGGSALASDLIWREVRRLSRKKPVVAAMRAVAASGGYYIAVGAHEVVADASTLTGSIGVVAGKISIAGALDRAHIRRETIELGAFATLLSARHPWDEDDIEALRSDIRRSYRRFVNRVAVGRGMASSRVHLLARGRVYTGRQAAERGLVDAVGTVRDAIARAAHLADVPLERARVRYRSLQEPTLRALLSGAIQPPGAWLRALEPAVDEALELAALLKRDPVLAYFDGALLTGPE